MLCIYVHTYMCTDVTYRCQIVTNLSLSLLLVVAGGHLILVGLVSVSGGLQMRPVPQYVASRHRPTHKSQNNYCAVFWGYLVLEWGVLFY